MSTAIGVLLVAAFGLDGALPGYGDISRGSVVSDSEQSMLALDMCMRTERLPLGSGPVTWMLIALEGAVRGPGGLAPSQTDAVSGAVNIKITCDGDIRPLRVVSEFAFLCANEVFVNVPVTDGPAPMILIEFEVLAEMEGLSRVERESGQA